jgi:4-hydroxy-3-polyprenylbenzoate decarboxylase
MSKKVTLGITGASGIPIAFSLLQELLKHNCIVHLVLSRAAMITVKQETAISLSGSPNKIKEILVRELNLTNAENFFVFGNDDWYAPIASGSSVNDVTIVCPCSMATLGKIASFFNLPIKIKTEFFGLKIRLYCADTSE